MLATSGSTRRGLKYHPFVKFFRIFLIISVTYRKIVKHFYDALLSKISIFGITYCNIENTYREANY